MWQIGGTWLISLLAIAAGGGWLAGRTTRLLKRLRAESELVPLLPEGSEQDALRRLVRADAALYVQRRQQGRRFTVLDAAWAVATLGGLAAVAVWLIVDPPSAGDKAPAWFFWVAVPCVAVSYAGAGVQIHRAVKLRRQLRAIRALT